MFTPRSLNPIIDALTNGSLYFFNAFFIYNFSLSLYCILNSNLFFLFAFLYRVIYFALTDLVDFECGVYSGHREVRPF